MGDKLAMSLQGEIILFNLDSGVWRGIGGVWPLHERGRDSRLSLLPRGLDLYVSYAFVFYGISLSVCLLW